MVTLGEDHRVRAIGNLLLAHMFVMEIAAFLPEAALGGLEVEPALHRLRLIIGIGVGIDVPLAQDIVEGMRHAVGQAIR